jgi:hypothetical protein
LPEAPQPRAIALVLDLDLLVAPARQPFEEAAHALQDWPLVLLPVALHPAPQDGGGQAQPGATLRLRSRHGEVLLRVGERLRRGVSAGVSPLSLAEHPDVLLV